MDEGDKKWSKRINWAKCREPYNTELETLSYHWVEGVLTNEELALELLKLQSEVQKVSKSTPSLPATPMDDVFVHLTILTEALLSAELRPTSSPELRQEALDFMRAEFGRDEIQR